MNGKNFGPNLKRLLKELGLTQSEFAERCGITQAAVSQIINSERVPSVETIILILGVIPTTFERMMKDPK